MPAAATPANEAQRLRALGALDVLDSAPEREFDALVQAAALVCGAPISLISLVDADRQWFKANVGLPGVTETPRELAFCAHTILQDGIFEVPDALRDPRFADNALVTGEPGIRFYAGATLRLRDGTHAGTLCVIDRQPRELDAKQREVLGHLATAVVQALEGRRALLAERQLRDTASQAAAVLEHSLDAIVALSRDGKVTHWNAAAQRLFGYSPQEIMGQPETKLVPAHRLDEQRDLDTRLKRSSTGFNVETVRLNRYGEAIAVSISMTPIRDAQGELTGATKIIRDIREQASAARVLTESEARFKALSEASPLGVFATDSRGACTYTNERWQSIYGLTFEQSLGDGWAAAVHPDDRTAVFTAWQRTATLGGEFDMQLRILRTDGQTRTVRARARAHRDADDNPRGHVGSIEDVTEQLRAERELHDERARLASIIEGTGAGTWEWNVQTGEARFNERWAAIVGRNLDELGATSVQTWLDLAHPHDLTSAGELLEKHFAGELPGYDFEARMRHRDGHWVWVMTRGRVLTWTPDGRPEWMFGTHMDITDRKLQEEKLLKSERLLNRTGEVAGVGGWELDLSTGAIWWSTQTRLIHRVPPDYVPVLSEAINFYAPEARPIIQGAVERSMTTAEAWDLELPLIQATGQRIWVRAVGATEFEDGKPVRLAGAFQDITQRVLGKQLFESIYERMSLATESGGIGVWEWNVQTGQLTWDALMHALYGMPEGPVTEGYALWARHLHPDDRSRAEREIRAAVKSGDDFQSEFRVVWTDGSVHHLRAAGRVTFDAEGRALRMVGVNWDVTPLRQLSNELAERHELMRVTLKSIGDAVITTDARGAITWLNPMAERMTGWLNAEACGRPIGQVFHIVNEETREPTESPVAACLQQGELVGLAQHTVLISRNGDEFGIEDSASPIRNEQGELLGVVLVFHDVTEQRRLSGEMSYRATHDALTGLINRSEFETRLRRVLVKARDDDSEHALMFIDLDQFKLVNDACGHSVGDQLLQQVSKLLGDVVRARDTLARLGGDEFAVILEHCPVDQAQRVAQLICERMDDFRFMHDERRFRIGASIGLVPVDKRWSTTAAVIQAADTSCYAAKEAGRNRVHTWFDTDQAMRARHGEMQWAARLEQALDENRFVLFAQRIQALDDAPHGLHAEVLLRMIDTDGSLVQPGAFLPAAERFHFASRIDRWVLRHAIDALLVLEHLSSVESFCVNLSGQSIGDRAFHRQAIDTLTEAGPEVCRRLCLEITETAAVTNMADASVFIDQVRALGVRIALDDFGAGASSFGYLKNLNVDLLKIDGQFIRDLIDDPLDDAAVRCFVDVSRVVGVKTVAEFVDRAEVLTRVREIGIDFAQGFLLHRPEPIHLVLGTSLARVIPA